MPLIAMANKGPAGGRVGDAMTGSTRPFTNLDDGRKVGMKVRASVGSSKDIVA